MIWLRIQSISLVCFLVFFGGIEVTIVPSATFFPNAVLNRSRFLFHHKVAEYKCSSIKWKWLTFFRREFHGSCSPLK